MEELLKKHHVFILKSTFCTWFFMPNKTLVYWIEQVCPAQAQ